MKNEIKYILDHDHYFSYMYLFIISRENTNLLTKPHVCVGDWEVRRQVTAPGTCQKPVAHLLGKDSTA